MRLKVKSNAVLVALHPFGATTPLSNGFIFPLECFRGFLKSGAVHQLTKAIFVAQLKVPVLSDLLRKREAFLLRAFAPLLAFKEGVAVPAPALLTAVELHFVT